MEGVANAVVAIVGWIERQGVVAVLTLLSSFLMWIAFRERIRPNGPMTQIRKDLDDHIGKTASHFGLIEDRVAEIYGELKDFKIDVAKELATKDDLEASETRIKEHITLAVRRR